MTEVRLPPPIVRHPDPAELDLRELERALNDAVDGEVRFDAGTRAAYSTDGSNYRQVPIGVVVPRTVEAAVEAVAGVPSVRCAAAVPRRGYQPGRRVLQHGGGAGLEQVLQPAAVG